MSHILPKLDDKFIEEAATTFVAGKDVLAIAPLHDMSADEFSAMLAENETAIAKRIAAMESDGTDVRIKSRTILAKALHQIGDAVENNQIAPGQLTRVIEVLHKTSGLEAELRREEPEVGTKFSLVINFGDHKIVYGEAAKEANVLDGEAIDVTPEVEARDVE